MLLDAIHLTPDSETVAWMKVHATMEDIWGNPTEYTPKLYDMSGHWLTSQGWLDAALYSGMVVPDDYNGKNFRPEKAIARYEIALMTDRALGPWCTRPVSLWRGATLYRQGGNPGLDEGVCERIGQGRRSEGVSRRELPAQQDLHACRGRGDDPADAGGDGRGAEP